LDKKSNVKNVRVDYATWKILKQAALDKDVNIGILVKKLVDDHLKI